MRIFLKDNNVLQYEQKLNVSDIEIEYAGDADIAKKHVYLGENGVGKTFDFRMFVNTAYLYSVANPSPYHDIDAQRVMQNMIDVGIGHAYWPFRTANWRKCCNIIYVVPHWC